MRMWMIPVRCLCYKHLNAEHYEIHKAVGNLRHSGKWTRTLTRCGYLEPQNFVSRHDELAKEMLRRGYTHNKPVDVSGLDLQTGRVDVSKSYRDLVERCPECRRRIREH